MKVALIVSVLLFALISSNDATSGFFLKVLLRLKKEKPHLHSELLKWFRNTYMRKRGDTDVNWILASRAESAHRDLESEEKVAESDKSRNINFW